MKPIFALSLSFEGISLLYRVRDGWHVLGDVALGGTDLAAELETMRALTEGLDGPKFCTKLILPNDQIKYLTLDTGRGSRGKRLKAAHAALEAETPYSAGDLAVDIVANGRRTFVAAVARSTLAEAEAFAVEHRFNPVCFVAIPPEDSFPQEPQFGPTSVAASLLDGQSFEPDAKAIVITGRGLDKGAVVQNVPPAPAPIEDSTQAPVEAPIKAPVAPSYPDPEQPPNPTPIATKLAEISEAPASEAPTKAPPQIVVDAPNPPSGFSSIRAQRSIDHTENSPETPPTHTRAILGSAKVDTTGTNAPSLPPVTTEIDDNSQTPLRFDPANVIAGFKTTATPTDGASDPDSPPKSGSFLSRRSARKPQLVAPSVSAPQSHIKTAAPIDADPTDTLATTVSAPSDAASPSVPSVAATQSKPAKAGTERRNMAVFGARDGDIGGKPRHLGLILAFILMLFLAGVAVWASLFLEDGVAGLIRRDPAPQIAGLEVESQLVQPVTTPTEPVETDDYAPVGNDTLTDSAEIEAMTDDAVADALVDKPLTASPDSNTSNATDSATVDAPPPPALTKNQAEARYAVTGIWERAPLQTATPAVGSTDTLYVTSIDRNLGVGDPVALPREDSERGDWSLPRQASPPPAGTRFDLDERGLVRATPKGAMSPDGVMVYLGRPAILPNSFPDRKPALGETVTPQRLAKLGGFRPKLRPDDLIETNERASYGGRTLTELAHMRPRLRPALAKADEEKDTTATAAAVTASLRPRQRPSNFAQLVARATPSEPVVASPVSATVSPNIPSSASVARQATLQNAINLNKINLIGVYGTSSSRRALVRLSNGRFKKVQVGDRIDGGKIAAISDTELRYVKSGRNVILKLPKG